MKKKIISLVILCVLILSAGVYYYIHQPKNIFDEIYWEMKTNYLGTNIFYQIKDAEIKNYKIYDKDMNETNKFSPSISYPDYYLNDRNPNLRITFNLYQEKGFNIYFEKYIDSKVSINFSVHYITMKKTLNKKISITNSNNYIEDESKVKSYLQDYGITAADLESYYNEIVNQKILTDWCSIYDSKFSPEDYGNVTVKTQWENW
ncbi:TipC family immunity protein [Streptococcus gallolyticus]|uniref:TipC family immunity protein n=1 Tax=Streptococcus gallolyticus TaxID=315405 RepID=UPI0022B6E5A7|nr:TipC family immunity protein [Streptococcus gallolyticus]WAW98430.1 TipC family immunity protein [Streptococcus gallolyticus]